jgi:hypothetical protein
MIKGSVQSICKQSLCLHFGIQNIELSSTTIYIFMLLQYNKLSRYIRVRVRALQEHNWTWFKKQGSYYDI